MIHSLFISKANTDKPTFLTVTLLALLIAMAGCDAPSDSLDVQGESSEPGKVVTAESMGYEVEMTDLGPGTPGEINNAGQIVGTKEIEPDVFRGFLWEEGNMTLLEPLPGDTSSFAYAINNKGRILGSSDDVPITWKNGKICKLCALKPGSTVFDINDKGQILGGRPADVGISIETLFLFKNGNFTEFDIFEIDIPFGDYTINNNGIVAGTREVEISGPPGYVSRAFIWNPNRIASRFTNLGTLNYLLDPSVTLSAAYDINDKAQVVGWSDGQAFLWEDDSGMVGIGIPEERSKATGINNHSQIVGVTGIPSEEGTIFLWENGTMIDLGIESDRFESDDSRFSINDNGQILGKIETDNGQYHIVVLEIKKG